FPFQVRNTSSRPVDLVAVEPIRQAGVEVDGFFVTGPQTPSWSTDHFLGWPPETWPDDDPDAAPTPKLTDFHDVDGFTVKPKPENPESREAWGKHDLYSDLSNEATIVMKYRLQPTAQNGGVKGFRVAYRLPGHRARTLEVPH